MRPAPPSLGTRVALEAGGLGGVLVEPSAPLRGVCVATHAMMVDGRTLAPSRRPGPADVLAARGIAVACLDLPGHGRSADRRWELEDLVGTVLPAALAELGARRPGVPVTALGHSLGGVLWLAVLATGSAAPAGLVTVAANVWCPGSDPDPRRRAMKAGALALLRELGRLGGASGVPARRLRLGSADVPAGFMADLRRWHREGWTLRAGGAPLDEGLAGCEVPVLAVTARRDRWRCAAPVAGHLHRRLPRVTYLDAPPPAGHMTVVTGGAARSRGTWEEVAAWLAA